MTPGLDARFLTQIAEALAARFAAPAFVVREDNAGFKILASARAGKAWTPRVEAVLASKGAKSAKVLEPKLAAGTQTMAFAAVDAPQRLYLCVLPEDGVPPRAAHLPLLGQFAAVVAKRVLPAAPPLLPAPVEETLQSRYQRLLLLNRVAIGLFSGPSLAESLQGAGHGILALSGGKHLALFARSETGKLQEAFRLGDKRFTEQASQTALAAAAGLVPGAAPSWSPVAPLGWFVLPIGSKLDGALAIGCLGAPPAPGAASLLRDVCRMLDNAMRAERQISERKEIERIREEFMILVTHDMRTPLTSISGFAESMIDFWTSINDEEKLKYLDVILRESKRMGRLVDDFLDLSRFGAAAPEPLARSETPLAPLLEGVVEVLRGYAKGVTLAAEAAPDLGTLALNRDKIERVLINLGGNAIKYSPPGSTVRFGAARVKGAVEFWVSDEGPGIPKEARARLFDKYYRVDGPVNEGVKGTGLGLAVCKLIVEAHGGSIGVESAPGAGAVFKFRIPTGN